MTTGAVTSVQEIPLKDLVVHKANPRRTISAAQREQRFPKREEILER